MKSPGRIGNCPAVKPCPVAFDIQYRPGDRQGGQEPENHAIPYSFLERNVIVARGDIFMVFGDFEFGFVFLRLTDEVHDPFWSP